MLFAQQIERLAGFLGAADNPLREGRNIPDLVRSLAHPSAASPLDTATSERLWNSLFARQGVC
jgi:hypothetical protein